MWWYNYLLKSKKDSSWYIGCTNNLKNREKMHNLGKVKSTRNSKPWELIYYEACKNKINAFRRERYLKSGYGRRFLKKRLMEYNSERKVIENY
ncbi:hypothetical protein A3A76_00010 [Candidatus Woesebacteria bacterium RIFCSPLOWO2_01_FULL_39_23]|uniref:GIY-YIG domain-containing protein n=1 Tax=Candidatus Woesebacteria bacterium RIFCSPHIGHO2_01_FULL_40_22 TaxID=1802499 RepID=A0A1F7YI59_9BACT|nr:MAG: hypothetical protein A2141_03140 [Candidatus Woesebacteria bacterium RBG_16_40_11]OGM26268.1 MAG: hypothetical protein A2628_03630 [Candidatus Woesebacteria bacterium RIFCSPHIGHO2_01_FULL_40_22]OGM36636.1 MAG: hypothetical protein A3E41_01855 [Candidatus Woesebacteria bacterium RIFCSPHIGHO2_12_FULL_38_9]OGM62823.1 MAG: hypothetical protein A3A76_00010 [Candidatus Woesebacteria bacterium RIFCSPLOWO2_01_FULL_39_23]